MTTVPIRIQLNSLFVHKLNPTARDQLQNQNEHRTATKNKDKKQTNKKNAK
jgi:hypothetical protein